jgi:hypothetical protein
MLAMVRVLDFPQQFVHAFVEAAIGTLDEVRVGAQTLQQAQRVELAVLIGVVTHGNKMRT